MSTTCTETLAKAAGQGIQKELLSEVQRGLLTKPRSLAPWIFYDDRGSYLFERITTLIQYYPTRTERNILAQNADAIIAALVGEGSKPLRILELGAGMASKTGLLLEAAAQASAEVLYMPLDVSPDALDVACKYIDSRFPEVRTERIVLNYVKHPPKLEEFEGATLVLYLGSSIGNFSPEEARCILGNISNQMQPQDAFVLGMDLVKDVKTLLAAYDDDEGVTAAFNQNILRRLNRELGADFDLSQFRHRASWNEVHSRVEMHLESTIEQEVRIRDAGLRLTFAQGETIHTENSYKFGDQECAELLVQSGLTIESTWKDEREWYAVRLARASAIFSSYSLEMPAL